jgi:hypothetical protein
MKDSMSTPHVLNKEDLPENFTGQLKGNQSISLKNWVTQNLFYLCETNFIIV